MSQKQQKNMQRYCEFLFWTKCSLKLSLCLLGIGKQVTVKELLGQLKRLAPVMGLLPVYHK